MSRLLVLLTLILTATPSFADKPFAPESIKGTTLISAEQLVEMIDTIPHLVIVDARRREEYVKGHIEGAVCILDTEMTSTMLSKNVRSKEAPVVFYCNGERCMRSTNAVKKAVSWGYHRVYWFRGGWQEWNNKGLPVSQ